MTTNTTPSRYEWLPPTTDSESANALEVVGVSSTTSPVLAQVFTLSFVDQRPTLPANQSSIGDVIGELERDPEMAALLAEARTQLLPQFDSAEQPTIRGMRLSRGLSQQQLAHKVRTSQAQIARIEAGAHDPTYDTFARLAGALDVSVADVVVAFGRVRDEAAKR